MARSVGRALAQPTLRDAGGAVPEAPPRNRADTGIGMRPRRRSLSRPAAPRETALRAKPRRWAPPPRYRSRVRRKMGVSRSSRCSHAEGMNERPIEPATDNLQSLVPLGAIAFSLACLRGRDTTPRRTGNRVRGATAQRQLLNAKVQRCKGAKVQRCKGAKDRR